MKFFPLWLILVSMTLALKAQQPPGAQHIAISDHEVTKGFSPYNWIKSDKYVATPICGASLQVAFQGTRSVTLDIDPSNLKTTVASRFPIVAWTVNGGPVQAHQLVASETSFKLCADTDNPKIDLYVKGMSPFEDRYNEDIPANAVKLTGFEVDAGGKVVPAEAAPHKVWLNIGDSIMSGDGAAYSAGQGRPPDDAWAASDDARASYGYLLAQHYGYGDARLAWGGYNWTGGGGNNPRLSIAIDNATSTVSRLDGSKLNPPPEIILLNLGENGVPPASSVTEALEKIRSRAGDKAKLIVMIPISGRGRKEITAAFESYKKEDMGDAKAYLIDLGDLAVDFADGQHPTASGHRAVYEKLLPKLDEILKQ